MATSSNPTTIQSSTSSDRTPVLGRTNVRTHPSKATVARLGGAARRLMSALMQSLAVPHI